MGNPFFIYTFISQYDVLDGWSWMISLFRVYLPPALSDYKLFIKGVYLKWENGLLLGCIHSLPSRENENWSVMQSEVLAWRSSVNDLQGARG